MPAAAGINTSLTHSRDVKQASPALPKQVTSDWDNDDDYSDDDGFANNLPGARCDEGPLVPILWA